jgi:predicted ThiF/HesA family dinucleotide-utilizing enzyme
MNRKPDPKTTENTNVSQGKGIFTISLKGFFWHGNEELARYNYLSCGVLHEIYWHPAA